MIVVIDLSDANRTNMRLNGRKIILLRVNTVLIHVNEPEWLLLRTTRLQGSSDLSLASMHILDDRACYHYPCVRRYVVDEYSEDKFGILLYYMAVTRCGQSFNVATDRYLVWMERKYCTGNAMQNLSRRIHHA